MGARDEVLCPECGWTGARSDLDAADGPPACPVCETTIDAGE